MSVGQSRESEYPVLRADGWRWGQPPGRTPGRTPDRGPYPDSSATVPIFLGKKRPTRGPAADEGVRPIEQPNPHRFKSRTQPGCAHKGVPFEISARAPSSERTQYSRPCYLRSECFTRAAAKCRASRHAEFASERHSHVWAARQRPPLPVFRQTAYDKRRDPQHKPFALQVHAEELLDGVRA